MPLASKFILPAIVFLLTVATGIWLSRSGKPYNASIFNFHKFLALGVILVNALQRVNLPAVGSLPLLIPLLALIAVSMLALFVTGAFLSLGRFNENLLCTIHKIAPVVFVVAMAALVYILAAAINQ